MEHCALVSWVERSNVSIAKMIEATEKHVNLLNIIVQFSGKNFEVMT